MGNEFSMQLHQSGGNVVERSEGGRVIERVGSGHGGADVTFGCLEDDVLDDLAPDGFSAVSQRMHHPIKPTRATTVQQFSFENKRRRH